MENDGTAYKPLSDEKLITGEFGVLNFQTIDWYLTLYQGVDWTGRLTSSSRLHHLCGKSHIMYTRRHRAAKVNGQVWRMRRADWMDVQRFVSSYRPAVHSQTRRFSRARWPLQVSVLQPFMRRRGDDLQKKRQRGRREEKSRSRPSEIDKPEFEGRSVENVHGNDHNKETQQKRYSQIVLTSSCDLIDRSERKTWRNFKLQGHKSAAAPGRRETWRNNGEVGGKHKPPSPPQSLNRDQCDLLIRPSL
ncbi:uncharacterized protein LOC119017000 [Acanthopagrus latus]|uniref:uncharacterized protein LOC119017000 n=1 Tax=Acanthopagrus latus TaxID=8177 RepID=UPI00187C5AA2|nr:uncharacterized protein LOC119017000 [Acanthopagrus latus]